MSHRAGRVVAALAIAFVLVPWGWAKVAAATLAMGLVGHRWARGGRVGRALVAMGAGIAFWIAHVASPYWLLAPSPIIRVAALCALVVLTIGWAHLVATEIRLRPRPISAWIPVTAAAIVTLVCLPGLAAPLEFRGDEDFHVARPLAALQHLQTAVGMHGIAAAALSTLAVIALALRPRFTLGMIVLALAVAPVGLAALFATRPPPTELLVKLGRYPILSAWLHTAAAFSPAHLWPGLARQIYDETLYRIVPLVAALLLGAWVVRIVPGPPLRRGLAALALATSPIVLYYATALYIELPAVVLVTIGLYGFDVAARRELGGRRDTTGALSAVSLGLLFKETTAALGLLAVAVSGVWALRARPLLPRARAWLRMATVLLLPIGVYLGWRLASPPVRAARRASFDLSAVSNVDLYALLAGALVTQIGPGSLLLAAVGIVASARRRPRAAALWAVTLVGTLIFLAGDAVRQTASGGLPVYWGHSRLILLVFPPLCCFALEAFRMRPPSRHVITAIAAAAALSNVALRPIGWDGSRPTRWGDVVAETAGERYPYDALYRWAATSGVRGEVQIVGRDYPYRDDFYIHKYALDVRVTAARGRSPRALDLRADDGVGEAMRELREELRRVAGDPSPAGSIVVAHLRAGVNPRSLPETLGPRRRLRSFALGASTLVVYGDPRVDTEGVR